MGQRGKLPEVEAETPSQWHFLMQAMMMESDWVKRGGMPITDNIAQWVFGEMYDVATPTEIIGMNQIVEVMDAVRGGYAGVEVPIEMGIINHPMLIEPINTYEFTRYTVEEGLKMLNEKQAFAWTTDGMMV